MSGIDGAVSSGDGGFLGPQGGSGGGGAQGAQGSSGAQGAQGATGAGSQGAQGTAGAQGSSGAQGAQGAQGATGVGAQGSQGAQGTAGAQGAQGAQGSSPVTTRTTLVGAPNNTITVGLSGTAKYLRIYAYLPTNATTGAVVLKYNGIETSLFSNWTEEAGASTVQGGRNLAQWEVAASTNAADRMGGFILIPVNAVDTFLIGNSHFFYGEAVTKRDATLLTTAAIPAITSISIVAANANAFSIGAYVEVTELQEVA